MQTLVLDIGGIFFRPLWREQGVRVVSKQLGVQKEQFEMALEAKKSDFYQGKMGEYDYWQSVLDVLGITAYTPESMQKMYREYITPIAKTMILLPELSKDHVLISCNNSPKEWMDERVRIGKLDQYFSRFYTSGYVHLQKPDRNMYSQVFAYASSFSKPVTYIDDNEAYVQIVRDLYSDVQVELYKNPDTLLRWIR